MLPRLGILLTVLLVAGCDLPRDPEGTLDSVRGDVLHVGELPGHEVALREDKRIAVQLAERLDARIVGKSGETHDLIRELAEGEIDLLIGGLPASTPFVNEIGLSNVAGPLPGVEGEDRVLAVRAGENKFLLEVNRAVRAARGEAP